jgi:hypothetical protein
MHAASANQRRKISSVLGAQHIIHPEEILAENFAQLATGKTGPSPEIHQRLLEALKRQTSMRR